MTNYAIITSAGSGKRMGSKVNKIFLSINQEFVISLTLKKFQDCDQVDHIVVIGRKEDIPGLEKLKKEFSKIIKVVEGGKERQDSVYNGLKYLKDHAAGSDMILIHNGVNPFVDEKTILDSIAAAKEHGASVVGFRARDTIKEVSTDGFVKKTLDRSKLWQVQTPQVIRYGLAMEAFNDAFENKILGTDDVMLVERLGKNVKVVECPYENIKITLPNDMEFADRILNTSRVGFGMDSHRFVQGKKLFLGGVNIDADYGFEGNSDGDVVLHALFNAISQGISERSISHYADPMCQQKGVTDSKEYLKVMLTIMQERGYRIGNIGIMIEGKKPRISDNEEMMKKEISSLCDVSAGSVGITATTGEDLTEFGLGKGLQCFCVVTLHRR